MSVVTSCGIIIFLLSSSPYVALLQSFLSVERIKLHFKGRLVGMVLDGYLSLRRYIVTITYMYV